ncbi:hypothetical protein SBA4_3960010 [Candidatus Sulfopaludibacter sp. SbA4]|nr:hypothetical protein SBA4_3960010 [Candidatus Sulfopaludibacter sp. SbA4]
MPSANRNATGEEHNGSVTRPSGTFSGNEPKPQI